MNSNKRANKVTMIDRHYKLIQLSNRVKKSVIPFPQSIDKSNILSQDINKAA